MGDIPVNVATFKSAVNVVAKRSKTMDDEKEDKRRRLRMALALMGFGSWENLEPGINITLYISAYELVCSQHLILINNVRNIFHNITLRFVARYSPISEIADRI